MAVTLFATFNTLLVLVGIVVVQQIYTRLFTRQGAPYPPGPPGKPIVGHLGLPENPAWIKFDQWAKQYGSDVIRLNVVGKSLIVLNSMKAAMDLLDKRSAMYSDRFRLVMTTELCGWSWNVVLQRYNNEWRDCRKLFHSEFGTQNIAKYRPLFERNMVKMLRTLSANPASFAEALRQVTGANIIYSAYGIEVQEKNDPLIALADRATEAGISTLTAGTYIVDVIPTLRFIPEWFPGAGFKRQARIWRKSVMDAFHLPFNISKKMMADDTLPQDSAARAFLENNIAAAKNPEYVESITKKTLASMYSAGADTTLSTLSSFFLAVVNHPEFQRRAQEEIDRVCHGRIPTFADYDALPYVHALVRESLRWNPVVPLNVAHQCTSDNIYNGYLIPKGSIVFANNWAIMHDPEVYLAPETFNPERFLRRKTNMDELVFEIDPAVPDPMNVAFGFGRRICPGRYYAYEVAWIVIAQVLSMFNIEPKKDAQGKPVFPPVEYKFAAVCYPKPFECMTVPRSAEFAEVVKVATQDA